jgi:hypothetical protein
MAEVPGSSTVSGRVVPTIHFAHVQVQHVAPVCTAEQPPLGKSEMQDSKSIETPSERHS